MIKKFNKLGVAVSFDDGAGNRRWPPRFVAPVWGRRVVIDPMIIGAALTLAATLVGTVVGIWWFWTVGVTLFDVAMALLGVVIINLGITVGYHRYFAHNSFRAKPWVVALLGILGAMSMQGQIMTWASVHRRHHHHCDTHEDPHTPKSMGAGLKAMYDGFVAGYVGWVVSGRLCTYVDYVRDLRRDRIVQWVDRWYWLWVVLGWIIPGLIGAAWYGGWTGFWSGFFAGGAIRSFLHLNATGLVNTLGHLIGGRPFLTKDDSANSMLVNAITVNGEGLHNNHHAIPWSARFSMFKGDVDPGYWVLIVFERLGLVWDLKIPSAEYVASRAKGTSDQRDILQA